MRVFISSLASPSTLLALAVLAGPLAHASPAQAQLASPAEVATAVPTIVYSFLDGPGVPRRVEVAADGSMLLLANGRAFRTALGTDRVILVGPNGDAELEALEVALDEVLSARAGIVAVRSTRTSEGALALAQRLAIEVERGRLASASPDLALEHVRADIGLPPNDPRYGGQWFYETIDLAAAWAREDGDPSVTVAVVDNGCDGSHPDLAPHLLPGYDAVDDDDDPSFLPATAGNEHGTACAGLVAAVTDNGLDVAGSCPECSLRCIRLLAAPGTLTPISTDVRAFDFVLMHDDIAVVSNSWGFEAGAPAPLALVRVIQQVMTTARGGLGALVVFAAGNDASVIGTGELQAIPGVLNVGAINTFDEAASFSNSGESVALVAPTGTLTTDIVGAEGEDPGDVTTRFGGTSSACPIVAGVAGLLASARPDLGGAELRAALVDSVRPAPFASPDELGHDPLYGFGIIDPSAALTRVLPGEDAGPTSSDGGASAPDGGTAAPASGGCGCRATRGGGPLMALTLLALGALLALRRRRSASGALLALALASSALSGCATEPAEARPTVLELRPNTPGAMELPPQYDATDVVDSVVSPAGAFRIHFTRAGRHAVPATDADADGTPDHVALVARTYDAVLTRYVELGFRAPRPDGEVPVDNGGDALFDVYLLDFGGGSDGSFRRESCVPGAGCTGYMLQENDFVGFGYPSIDYATRLLASHELFHAVQAAYDDGLGTQGSVLSESTAVWASERFDPSLSDVERLASGYTSRTDRSLGVDPATAGGAYSYGAGIVFEYLSTRFGDELVRELWEDLDARTDGAEWLTVLDERMTGSHGTTFEVAFLELAEWMMFLGARADATRGPTNGAQYEPVAAMLVDLPYEDRSVRMFPASIRYFVVRSGQVAVVLGGAPAADIELVAVGFDGTRYAARASGRGSLELDEASADTTILALVDGRTTGMSRVVSLCIASSAAECAAPSDAGTPDGGLGDASPGEDAGTTPAPGAGCSCRVGPRTVAPRGLALLASLALLALGSRQITQRRTTATRRGSAARRATK